MTAWTRRAALVGTAVVGAFAAAFSIRRGGWFTGGGAMNSENLRARLTAAGLGRVADDIIRVSMPSIRMNCRRAAAEGKLPLGASKLGGTPALPPGKSWPAWQGSPMAFIGQVKLAEIAAHDEEKCLPHAGLLSFFCAIDGTAAGVMPALDNPSSWMVSYFDGDLATLVRLPHPPDLPELLQFPACQASFSQELTLPNVESREVLALELTELERQAYVDVESGADIGYLPVMNHHLLGYPHCLGRSPFIAGYRKAHGIPDPYAIDLQGTPEELQRKLTDLQHKAETEWRLLLQVYSNEEAEMDFGGGGVLHFCIPKEALARRDFSHVWVEMQFV
jgi:uncharacterized protein YwqG